MKKRTLNVLNFVIAIILTIALAACGSTPKPAEQVKSSMDKAGTNNASPITYDGPDRQQKLEEGAKQEKTLTWYTSLTETVANPLVQKFNQKYPFIKVEIFRADAANLAQRITQEAQAGRNTVDMLESNQDTVMILKDQRLITPFYSANANKLPEKLREAAEGKLVWNAKDRVSYVSFGYNTKSVPQTAVPKKMEDLLNPELKGKLSIAGSTAGVRWIGAVLNLMGETEGKKFLQKMSENQNLKVDPNLPGALIGMLVNGSVVASPTIIQNHVVAEVAKGSTVDWVPVEPVVLNWGTLVVSAKAPHPNATILFIEWLLSEEGQAEFSKLGYSSPAEPVKYKTFDPESVAKSSQEYSQIYRTWQQLMDQYFLKK